MDIAKIRKRLKESPKTKADASSEAKGMMEDSQREAEPVEVSDDIILREAEEAEEIVELLVFGLFDEEYAFKVSELEEIIRPQHITYIPKTPEYLLGVTSLRGRIIPIIDLKKMLFLTGNGESTKQKIIILKGKKGSIGVRVDRISGVVRLPVSKLTEGPSHLNESQLRYIEQVAVFNNRFIAIINTEEISNNM